MNPIRKKKNENFPQQNKGVTSSSQKQSRVWKFTHEIFHPQVCAWVHEIPDEFYNY